jgi:predicted O-methyltransferase YrrM
MTNAKTRWIERIKYSPLGPLATLPLRIQASGVPLLAQSWQTAKWLVGSREWANFSYDYDPVGLQTVLCAINTLTGHPLPALRNYAQELGADSVFAQRYQQRVQHTRLRWTCDPDLRLARCLVNYVLVRALQPQLVFEAGTDRGLSTWAMCRAVRRNLEGGQADPVRIITVDIAADRGEFLEGDEGGLVQRLVGDSVAALRAVPAGIDLFLHDTTNHAGHTQTQLQVLADKLAPGGAVHSCWFSAEFASFCEEQGLRALEYVERPADHWYAGRRCGLAQRVVGRELGHTLSTQS